MYIHLIILKLLNDIEKCRCVCETLFPEATKWKMLFLVQRSKSRSHGHWYWCHVKGHHWWSMHAKHEVSISYGSKVIAKVKVDNIQTNKQTSSGQNKNNMSPIIPGHKLYYKQQAFFYEGNRRCILVFRLRGLIMDWYAKKKTKANNTFHPDKDQIVSFYVIENSNMTWFVFPY